ncbi:MAG: phage integrase N-terminal SAM-like domain-containing protein [Prolixibacteraceae bacterium]
MEKEFIESMTQQIEANKKVEEAEIHANKGWTIAEGIEKFEEYCEKKNLSPNTIRTYKTFITNFEAWLEETEQKGIIASEITEDTIQEFLDQQFDEEEWSSRTYNNHINSLLLLSTLDIIHRTKDVENHL